MSSKAMVCSSLHPALARFPVAFEIRIDHYAGGGKGKSPSSQVNGHPNSDTHCFTLYIAGLQGIFVNDKTRSEWCQ
jgi:hypothetical protein